MWEYARELVDNCYRAVNLHSRLLSWPVVLIPVFRLGFYQIPASVLTCKTVESSALRVGGKRNPHEHPVQIKQKCFFH